MRPLLLALVMLWPAAAVAAPPQQPAPASPPAAAAPAKPAAAGQTPAVSVEPQGFDYDPDGRRDPFVSLLRRGTDIGRSNNGPRPAGLAGLETSEVALQGTLKNPDGYVAILHGDDGKTYIVRVGDKLFDGTIRSITADAVVILQPVNDPLSVVKQREVRKTIRQNDEAK